MKNIFLFVIFAGIILLGVGLYFYWPEIDQKLSGTYTAPPEEESYFEEDESQDSDGDQKETIEFEEITSDQFVSMAEKAIQEDPLKSWHYLEQALEKDPENTRVYIYRARMLEGAGKPSLAKQEYELAFADQKKSSSYADQYAGFLMRKGEYSEAQNLLYEYLDPPSSDAVWLKALFLDMVFQPTPFKWSYYRIPKGNVKPLVHYVLQLPKGQFWSGAEYDKIAYGHDFLEHQQITMWLQLLEALNQNKPKLALNLLENNPFQSESWNPQLEMNLRRILNYKLNRSLEITPDSPIVARYQKSAQNMTPLTYLLEELEENHPDSQIPDNSRELLLSPEIYTLALLDTGWNEAALQLHKVKHYPSRFPENMAYNFTLALRKQRGDQEALDFAKEQNSNPQMDLLLAELRIKTGEDEELAINQLHFIAHQEGDLGFSAAKILAETYLERKEYEKAKDFIERTPNLANMPAGQELLAQIFLEQNQPELAARIYVVIVDDSSKARRFLAQKAIDERQWDRARELTEKLIAEFPDDEEIRRNLKYIQFKSR